MELYVKPSTYTQFVDVILLQPLSYAKRSLVNRTWGHFCSYLYSFFSMQEGYLTIVQNGIHIHFIHPVFSPHAQKNPL